MISRLSHVLRGEIRSARYHESRHRTNSSRDIERSEPSEKSVIRAHFDHDNVLVMRGDEVEYGGKHGTVIILHRNREVTVSENRGPVKDGPTRERLDSERLRITSLSARGTMNRQNLEERISKKKPARRRRWPFAKGS